MPCVTINLNYKNLFHYLRNTAICQKCDLDYMKVDVKASKNFHWVIELPENRGKLVVKQTPHYSTLYSDDRIRQEWHIYNFLQSEQNLNYASSLTPEVLYFDESDSILIYKLQNEYITLESYYENDKAFQKAIADLVGTTLAKLHYETSNSQTCYALMAEYKQDKLRNQLPYPDDISHYLVNPLEPESLKKTPAQSWRFLGLFQQSETVKKVVTELVSHHHHRCLTHNNIQFNNILIVGHWEKFLLETKDSEKRLIKLIDWEACSWGDPACDLGKAVAGYFLFWINSMILHPTIEMKKSLQLATMPLEVVRPSMVALIKAYISTYPKVLEDYPEFIKRVIQFAGISLLYQLLAEFQLQPEIGLNHQEIYFHIATKLLCQPEKFMSI